MYFCRVTCLYLFKLIKALSSLREKRAQEPLKEIIQDEKQEELKEINTNF